MAGKGRWDSRGIFSGGALFPAALRGKLENRLWEQRGLSCKAFPVAVAEATEPLNVLSDLAQVSWQKVRWVEPQGQPTLGGEKCGGGGGDWGGEGLRQDTVP